MTINAIDPSAKKHTAAKVAGTVLTAAAATGVAMYLAKTGRLDAIEGGNKYIEQAKATIKKPADFLNGKLSEGLKKVSESEVLNRKMAQVKGYAESVIGKVKSSSKLAAAKDFVKAQKDVLTDKAYELKGKAVKYYSEALDFVESKINPEKFL